MYVSPVSIADLGDYVSGDWLVCEIKIDGIDVSPSSGLLDFIDEALSVSDLVGLQCGVNVAFYSYNDARDVEDDDCNDGGPMAKRTRLI